MQDPAFLRPRQLARRVVCHSLLTLILLFAWINASADNSGYGGLFRSLVTSALEDRHQIGVLGFAHVTASVANNDIGVTSLPQGRGRNIQPQSGLSQNEGLNLNQLGLIVCKGDGCPPGTVFESGRNVLSRVTPTPAPRGEKVIVDWAVSAVFGEDAFFWKNKGFDDFTWGAGDTHRLSITQWYLDIYVPFAAGTSILVGSWHSPLAAEIGYTFVPPNQFASRSYAFMAGPSKHVGVLAQSKLAIPAEWGLLSLSFGVTSDWNSIDFGSGAGGPSFMFGFRWRSEDMKTWLDFESIYGNGEDDFGDAIVRNGRVLPLGGGSQYLALSSSNDYLDRFVGYLVLNHAMNNRTSLVAEAVYGHQQGGDIAPSPIAITKDSDFYGINLGGRYQLAEKLHAGLRLEWFRDDNAASVLWRGVGAGGGNVYAMTLNLAWQPSPYLLLRPELKFDSYDGDGHLFAPGRDGVARRDSQLLGVMNFEFRF